MPGSQWRTYYPNIYTIIYSSAAVFLITLQSFYFSSLGGAVLCYIGLIMLVPLMKNVPVPISVVTFFSMLSVGNIVGVIISGGGLEGLKSVAGAVVSSVSLIIVYCVYVDRIELIKSTLKVVILLHFIALLVQILYFYVSGQYFDVLEYLDLGEQRVFSLKGLEFNGIRVPRFSGLFNEPGTYATIIVPIVAVDYVLSRRVGVLTILVPISAVATMSLGGMLIAILFLLLVGCREFLNQPRWRFAIVSSGVFLFSILLWRIFGTFQLREELDINTQDGMAWALSLNAMTPFGYATKDLPGYYSAGYLGVWLDFYIGGGIWALGSLVAFLASFTPFYMCVLVIVLLSKAKLSYPLLFVLLAMIKIACEKKDGAYIYMPYKGLRRTNGIGEGARAVHKRR